jgi:hypothetical protein
MRRAIILANMESNSIIARINAPAETASGFAEGRRISLCGALAPTAGSLAVEDSTHGAHSAAAGLPGLLPDLAALARVCDGGGGLRN